MIVSRRNSARRGRTAVAVLVYLIAFGALLLVLLHYFAPAVAAATSADPARRRMLAAEATLVLSVVLLILLFGLLITFRIGRFFRPREQPKNPPTKYVDAWAESARRMKTPDAEQLGHDASET